MDTSEEFTQRLRTVFDVCDEENEGYISVKHFTGLAREHFGASEEGGGKDINLDNIIKVLDPHGLGQIRFEDFCHGVRQIMDIRASTSPVSPISGLFSFSTPRSSQVISADTEDLISAESKDISELSVSTYQEYDMTDEDALPSNLIDPSHLRPYLHITGNISEDDRDSAISGPSPDLQDPRRVQELSDEEERYEDYGESEGEKHGVDLGDKLKIRKNRSHNTNKEASSKLRKNLLSCQLFRPASNQGSRRSSFSEEVMDDIDENFQTVNEKVHKLEDQIHWLTENQNNTTDKHVRLKEENTVLIERIHMLEEQLREMEIKSKQALQDEDRKHKDVMARHEREKQEKLDTLNMRLQHVEREYKELKEDAPRLKAEIDKLRKEKDKAEDRLAECQDRLAHVTSDHQNLHETLQHERAEHDKMQKQQTQIVEELNRELDEHKRENSQLRFSCSSDVSGRLQDLETHISKLQQENKKLNETNDELNAMLLCKSVEEGRSLLHQPNGDSLAAELEQFTKDELMSALQEQQDVNTKLREYVDRIILTILESNPSILEIKGSENS